MGIYFMLSVMHDLMRVMRGLMRVTHAICGAVACPGARACNSV
ncbi:hypothetical protein [uncultured Bartonella sp.]|nr:hypothetical protein [uncultured Bartonella sp.]